MVKNTQKVRQTYQCEYAYNFLSQAQDCEWMHLLVYSFTVGG